jgi:hypothetical protein
MHVRVKTPQQILANLTRHRAWVELSRIENKLRLLFE